MKTKTIEHETTFNSLGSGLITSILKKNKEYAQKLLDNPGIKIVIEV